MSRLPKVISFHDIFDYLNMDISDLEFPYYTHTHTQDVISFSIGTVSSASKTETVEIQKETSLKHTPICFLSL